MQILLEVLWLEKLREVLAHHEVLFLPPPSPPLLTIGCWGDCVPCRLLLKGRCKRLNRLVFNTRPVSHRDKTQTENGAEKLKRSSACEFYVRVFRACVGGCFCAWEQGMDNSKKWDKGERKKNGVFEQANKQENKENEVQRSWLSIGGYL